MAAQVKEKWRKIKEKRFYKKYEVSNFGRVRNLITGVERNPCISKHGYLFVTLDDWNKKCTSRAVQKLVAQAFIGDISNKKIVFKDGNKSNARADNLELIDCAPHIKKEVWRDVEDNLFFGKYAVSNVGRVKQLVKSQKVNKGYILHRLHQKNGVPYVELVSEDGRVRNRRIVDLVAAAFLGDHKGRGVHFKDGDRTNVNADNLYYDGKHISYNQKPKLLSVADEWRVTRLHHRGVGDEHIDFLIKELDHYIPRQRTSSYSDIGAYLELLIDILGRFKKGSNIHLEFDGEIFYVVQQHKNILKIFIPNGGRKD